MDTTRDKKKLFADFPPVSTSAWEAKIQEDLKGADYEKKLIWKTVEGLRLKPYYRQEDLETLGHLGHFPGDFPFVRGKSTGNNDWRVREDIQVDDIPQANAKALDILMKGVDSLGFVLPASISFDKQAIDALLRNIYAHSVELNFSCRGRERDMVQIILDLVKAYNRDLDKIHGSVDYDPLAELALEGRFRSGEEDAFAYAARLIDDSAHLPHFRVLRVHADLFHNAGGDTVQELAFALAAGNEYLARVTDQGMSVTQVAPRIGFRFATGSNYFMEIAKYRAARLLWAQIVKAYGGDAHSAKMYIHATTSRWNKTVYDPHVNMLRTTTEAMSAILAGIDSLSVEAYDTVYGKQSAFGERIARNQQLLLKEESYLDKVVDPSAGSYFIESLTDGLAAAAWKQFQQVEAEGGYLQQVYEGKIQAVIAESARQRDMDIATRKIILLGLNQYPNLQERMPADLASSIWRAGDSDQESSIPTLKLYRGGEGFERLRSAVDRFVDQGGKRPAVFMLTYGNLAFRKARAGFATNFFACAGFHIIDSPGFKDIESGIEAALTSEAEFVVLCSSDEEYAGTAGKARAALGATATVVLAGYPKELLEELQAAGIREYIHIRSNVLESLQRFATMAGIEV